MAAYHLSTGKSNSEYVRCGHYPKLLNKLMSYAEPQNNFPKKSRKAN